MIEVTNGAVIVKIPERELDNYISCGYREVNIKTKSKSKEKAKKVKPKDEQSNAKGKSKQG